MARRAFVPTVRVVRRLLWAALFSVAACALPGQASAGSGLQPAAAATTGAEPVFVVALDPSDSYVLAVAGSVLGLTGDMDTGLALAEKAIRLNPNNAMAFKACATFYAYKGEVDRTVEHQQQCERLDPMGTAGWGGSLPYVIAYFCVGDYEKVVDWTARILREHPNAAPALRYGAASLALLGRTEEARQVIVRLLEHAPGFSIFEVRRHLEFDVKSPFKKPGVTESLYRGLRLAGLPE